MKSVVKDLTNAMKIFALKQMNINFRLISGLVFALYPLCDIQFEIPEYPSGR
jgi:hypothetical protein